MLDAKIGTYVGKRILYRRDGNNTKILRQNGKRKGELTIEDYTDNITLDFWNEEFLEFSHFFVPKIFVLIKLKLFRPFYSPNQIKIKVLQINLLNEVFEKKPKNLFVNLYADMLDKNTY